MDNVVTDDVFAAYAAEQERAAAEQVSKRKQSSGSYEEIAWTGLETGNLKLIRAVGGPPDSAIDGTTARTARVSMIVGDDGKKAKIILPEKGDGDHLLWRIMARIMAAEWVDNQKVYPVERSHPQIFNIVTHNGFTKADPQFIFDKGWMGRQVLLMNVIDREQMEWHRENKHTMLLSRNIGEGKDGTKFPEDGVPSYGFTANLVNLFKYYKSWEKYDIGIMRTGQKEAPYRIINASAYIQEVPDHLKAYVSTEDCLAPEEMEWERYDLSRIYKLTNYTKIYNRLNLTIAKIDATLGTHFLEELKDLVEKEKAEFAEANPVTPVEEDIPKKDPLIETASEKVAAPVTRQVRQPAETSTESSFDTTLLKGWNELKDSEKALIENIEVADGKVTNIYYKDDDLVLLACPSCSLPGTETANVCAGCGLKFS